MGNRPIEKKQAKRKSEGNKKTGPRAYIDDIYGGVTGSRCLLALGGQHGIANWNESVADW